MAVKLMAFLTKRENLGRDEFARWYEANHVPTILGVIF
jgi:hypothetical protein